MTSQVADRLHTVSCSGDGEAGCSLNGLAPQMRKPGMPHHAGQTCPSWLDRQLWPTGMGSDRSEKICWCTLSGGPPVMERDHLLESNSTSPLPSRVLEAVLDLTRVPWKP